MNKYSQFGRYTNDCPTSILDKIVEIKKIKSDEKYIIKILKLIREEFNPKKFKTTYTNNFKESRFISVRNILKKRQKSCGSMATVVASVMRNLGYPTKLINGMYIKEKDNMRHAWNEIYINGQWISFDITRKNFKLDKYHIKQDEFVDWEDLEMLIKK